MKILLTGATGYIAQRLLPVLLAEGHSVYCVVRDVRRFHFHRPASAQLQLVEADFLDASTLAQIPKDIEVAYYLIHSMSSIKGNFSDMEEICAQNFRQKMQETQVKQIVYLSGIVNQKSLSSHLASRKKVEDILAQTPGVALTTLRAGIIVGSGSASFEIIRDLVEKIPLMVTPKWVNTQCQPIAIRNVIQFLTGVKGKKETYHQSFDIGGKDILTYKEMLLHFAKIRKLQRSIFVLPFMTPKLSSYWLYFITSTSYSLAQNLVNSMKIEVICRPNNLAEILNISLLSYDEAIELAFDKIEQNQVLSSWKDAQSSDILKHGIEEYISVPVFGCFQDKRQMRIENTDQVLANIWQIGGETGWYYADFLWAVRGFIDQMVGGVGLRRGRTSPTELSSGQSLDFWRVILADKTQKHLLLYAEMKLPGEAWLSFEILPDDTLVQTATFRPLGLWGRLYWYALLPFHGFIFDGMLREIATRKNNLNNE